MVRLSVAVIVLAMVVIVTVVAIVIHTKRHFLARNVF